MKTLKIYAPFDGRLLEEIPYHTQEDLEKMLHTAQTIFRSHSNNLAPYQRIEILNKLEHLMQVDKENLIETSVHEGGKPYQDTKIEVERAINGVTLAKEHISRLKGEEIPMGQTAASTNRIAFTTREPIGIVAAISAFNHPVNLIIHQIIPAIAVGAPVIVKPASATPLSCIKIIQLLKKAGLPDGWCQLLIAEKQISEQLITDKRIAFFSFIGSSKIGWMLRSRLAPGTRCALEHGGVAPLIIAPDASIDELIPAVVKGGFYHAGQVCVSVQKVFVPQNNIDEIAQKLKEKVQALKVGDPLNKDTQVGPLISTVELERIHKWVEEAQQKGAKLLCGGKKISDTCYEPTLLVNPPLDTIISQNEVFGPVVCLYTYTNIEDAIAEANALDYGFQSAIFTQNIDMALDTAKKLNATAVMINDHTAFRVDWMPFGGRDHSGIGMGGIPYSMHEMTREKMIVIKSKVL